MSIVDKNINSVKTNRILSLSGGGVKGIAELVTLVEIEKITGKSISELFPIITGTSVGGLIAAMLTIPKEEDSRTPKYSAKEALDIFIKSAPTIFPYTILGSVKQLLTHKYNSTPLEEILNEHLKNNRLSNTTSRLLIPTNDLNSKAGEIEVFDSSGKYSMHIKVKDVVRATTAAPTYFSPVMNEKIIQGHNYPAGLPYAYADGGLGANRPAFEVLKILKKDLSREEKLKVLDHTMVCSINFNNSDETSSSIPSPHFDGILGWLIKGNLLGRIMSNCEVNATNEVKCDLSEEEFFEISLPITKETSSLDNANPKNIQELLKIGHKYVEEHKEQIKKLCEVLVNNLELSEKVAASLINEDIDEGFIDDHDIQESDESKSLLDSMLKEEEDVNDEGFVNNELYHTIDTKNECTLEGEEHTNDVEGLI